MNIRFFTYSQFHGKSEPVGSDYLRVHQLLKYWPEAALYKYGENPEVLIFTKVFCTPDYKFPANFKGVKILDICDPMWLLNADIVETAHVMDAVTCPTKPLADFISQFHANVQVVPDRFDVETMPRTHEDRAKTVVWFGYAHNAETFKPALNLLEELDLNLLVISNDDPILNQYSSRSGWYTYRKYQEETIYELLKTADFAVLPEGFRPEDKFKSNNKTIKANLAGLPVAKTADEMREFMEAEARSKWILDNYDRIKQEYDIKLSVEQYKRIIDEIKAKA